MANLLQTCAATCLCSPIVCATSCVQAPYYRRVNHHSGHLRGHHDQATNAAKSNPIYTIGAGYDPVDAGLSNMYGIGFTTTSASFISGINDTGNWGMYVAADGDARIWLEASNGRGIACSCWKAPIVCATTCMDTPIVKSNVLHAPGDLLIYADGQHTQTMFTSGSDRWVEMCCYLRVKGSAYVCGCVTSPKVFPSTCLMFDQSGTRSWYMCAAGGYLGIHSGDGAGTVYSQIPITIKGTTNNSGKSDFTVHTGGNPSMALSGGEFRVGDSDVNWSVAVRRDGDFSTYGQPLNLSGVIITVIKIDLTSSTCPFNL